MAYRRRASFRGLGATLQDLAAAIARMEGSCSAPGVCVNNNPGNLRAYAPGQPVDSRGIRIFPDYASGEAALISQEQTNIGRGLTLSEFFGGKPGVYAGYAPASDSNNPSGYTANVASWLGIDPNAPLSSTIGGGVSVPAGASSGAVDTGSLFDSSDSGDSGGGLSGAAILGLALAAVGLVFVVTD